MSSLMVLMMSKKNKDLQKIAKKTKIMGTHREAQI